MRYASAAEMQHDLLEARTAMRREGSHAAKVKKLAQPVNNDGWDLPTQRYVA